MSHKLNSGINPSQIKIIGLLLLRKKMDSYIKFKLQSFHSKILLMTFFGLLGQTLMGCTIEPKKTVPEKYRIGQISFHRVCAQCHGADAMGGGRAPTFLQEKFSAKNFTNRRMVRTILNGSDSGSMPSQKKKVTDVEIREIVKYIRHSQREAGITE